MRPRPTAGLSVVEIHMKTRGSAGITLPEILVGVVIGLVLVWLALPRISGGPVSGTQTQTLNNAKQLHLATQQMALDGETTKTPGLGWPGDTGGTFTNWQHQLVGGNYLKAEDFRKLMSGPGVIPRPGKTLDMKECALLVYAVSTNSPDAAVFLTSANFTNTPAGGRPLEKNAKPYGDKGFVVFRKGGDGWILLRNQATNTNLVGRYVPLLR